MAGKMPMKKKDMPKSHAHMSPKEHEAAMQGMMNGPKKTKKGKK